MKNINLLHISALECHRKVGFQLKEMQTPVPKHIEYEYLSESIFYQVKFWLFY